MASGDNKLVRRRPSMLEPLSSASEPQPETTVLKEGPIVTAMFEDAWDLFHAYIEIGRLAAERDDSALTLLSAVALRHVFECMNEDPVFQNLARQQDILRGGRPNVEGWVIQHCPKFEALKNIANAIKHSRLRTYYRPSKKAVSASMATEQRDVSREVYVSVFELANGIPKEFHRLMIFTTQDGDREEENVDDVLYETRIFAFDAFQQHRPDRCAARPVKLEN